MEPRAAGESESKTNCGNFCPRCGQCLAGRAGAKFCPRCGLPLSEPTCCGDGWPQRYLVPPMPVAGFQYHSGPERWDRLNTGDALELILEPDNPHDRFAVAIYHEGRQIGYVPRQVSEELFKLVRQGLDLNPRIASKSPLRPYGYHSVLFQIDVPLGYNLWKWPA